MDILKGIENFLTYINNNWTAIAVCIGLAIGVYKKISGYLNLTNEEKIKIAQEQIRETMLKFISDAEMDYSDWNKSGSIKRAQVIKDIYDKYPVLSKAANQEDVIKWIDKEIDNSLTTLRDIISKNAQGSIS